MVGRKRVVMLLNVFARHCTCIPWFAVSDTAIRHDALPKTEIRGLGFQHVAIRCCSCYNQVDKHGDYRTHPPHVVMLKSLRASQALRALRNTKLYVITILIWFEENGFLKPSIKVMLDLSHSYNDDHHLFMHLPPSILANTMHNSVPDEYEELLCTITKYWKGICSKRKRIIWEWIWRWTRTYTPSSTDIRPCVCDVHKYKLFAKDNHKHI